MFLKAGNIFTQLDQEDYAHYSQWKWGLNPGGYVRRTVKQAGKSDTTRYLHRLIVNAPRHLEVDHINGNILDNRKENLRLCTRRQNVANSKKKINLTSSYKGVHFDKRIKKWSIIKRISKTFTSEIEAAKFYDEISKLLDGEFAWLNFPEIPR